MVTKFSVAMTDVPTEDIPPGSTEIPEIVVTPPPTEGATADPAATATPATPTTSPGIGNAVGSAGQFGAAAFDPFQGTEVQTFRYRAHCRITVNGLDVTDRLEPHLVSVRVIDGSPFTAEIELDDRDARLPAPPPGAAVMIELGSGLGEADPGVRWSPKPTGGKRLRAQGRAGGACSSMLRGPCGRATSRRHFRMVSAMVPIPARNKARRSIRPSTGSSKWRAMVAAPR